MKENHKRMIACAMAAVMVVGNVIPAYAGTFGSVFDGNGVWSDTNQMTWTFSDGSGSVTIGRGSVFSDVHPEITDPEYFLKEAVLYPGEARTTLNSQGEAKSDYTEGTLPLLQEFVHSFDWINSDELTRLQKVHDRIAKGRHGNDDQLSGKPFAAVSFKVLEGKVGNCGDYALEMQRLASYVGLECVSYTKAAMHTATMVKINGQWLTVDPFRREGLFDNFLTIPVDFDTEYNRYANEAKNSDWYKRQEEQIDWQRQAEAGEITWEEYYQKIYPEMSVEEIQENFLSWDGYVDGLGN